MALLDMASSQSSFHTHFCTSRLQILRHGITYAKLTFRKKKRLPYIPRKVNFETGHLKMQGAVLIKAVATLEPKALAQSEGHMNDLTLLLVPDSSSQVSQYPSKDSAETTERERLRRMRISKANKGNVAWNKGRKHSLDVRQLIAERTKLAMQSPKVRRKLVNLRHAKSDETKLKIGVGVRVGWERRRVKIKVQELCHFEWQNLIAEASRKGYAGQDELQWNSYEVLSEQLEQEWLESIEWRRSNPKPKGGSRRVPKSPEQRKKISEAIAAKWADPDYRKRVSVAVAAKWADPDYCERISEAVAAKWADPDYRERVSVAVAAKWADPDYRKRVSVAVAAKWADPDYRERVSVAVAAKWADPDYRERVCAAISRHHGTPTIAERSPKRKPKDYRGWWNSRGACKRRSAKLMVLKWKNLIAEAARKGYVGPEELQWNSDDVLSKQLEQECLEIKSIEQSGSKPKPKGSEPQYSPEHRKKITAAIAAKWADPDYREQIYRAPVYQARRKAKAKPSPRRMKKTGWEQPLDPSLVCSWMVLNYYWTIRLNM